MHGASSAIGAKRVSTPSDARSTKMSK
uniref:Uncharacterized protein n=1 Tax=Arundo donax TaxID=35708 RepID=A0A0A9ATP4_ARUDO